MRLALVMLIPHALLAQSGGALVGTVTDRSLALVPHCAITLVHVEQGISRKAESNTAGEYVFNDLPAGGYTVEFSASGFNPLLVKGIEIHVASTIRKDATLTAATVSTVLEVESSNPMVKSETAEIGQVVDRVQIENLPLNGRNALSLVTLSSGAESAIAPDSRYTSLARPTLAGARAGETVFRIEGINVNSQNLPQASVVPGIDAIEEFRVVSQLAPASESSNATVSFALRAGSNQFHGTAYDFFRNNVLNSHPFFDRTIDTSAFRSTPDQLRYNQLGGGAGGPVRRNRTFFFANTQFIRQRTQTQTTEIYPTAPMLTGNFTGVNPLSGSALTNFGPVLDPDTQAPFPGNIVPASRFSVFAAKFLPVAFVPSNCQLCQSQGLGFNFAGTAPGFDNDERYSARIDHRLDVNDFFYGHFDVGRTANTSNASPIPVSALDLNDRSYLFGLHEIHIFNAALVNEFRAGYTRFSVTQQQEQDARGQFTFPNTPRSLPSIYPTVSVAGYTGLFGNGGVSNRSFELDESIDLANSLTWTRGKHEFKVGLEFVRAHFWNTTNINAVLIYADGLPASLGFTGSGFADFLIGVPLEGLTFQGTGQTDMVERSLTAGYLQDNWKISRSLTINAGIRYEYAQRWHDRDTRLNRLGTLDLSPASQALGGRFLLAGSPNYYLPGTGVVQGTGAPLIRGSLADPVWTDFQPRIGLAWRPFASNRTALRAGFGIYYAIQDANSIAFEELSPPFEYTSLIINLPPAVPVGRPLHDYQFFPAEPPGGVATEGADPRNRDPRTYQWTFSLEHQVTHNILLSAEYLGNHGVKLPFTVLPNVPAPPDAAQLASLIANPALDSTLALGRAPFSRVNLNYQYVENIAQSWYDALNLKAVGRARSNLTFSAVYTWSKALDMTSAEQQPPAIQSTLSLGKSYSDYDHAQRFIGSWVWQAPRVLKMTGWQIAGIATFETGPPYSILMGVDTAFTGGAAPSYPNLIGSPVTLNIRQSNGIYLAEQNFTAAPLGHYGTLARNALHGPGTDNYDLSALKVFSLRERLKLQFRAEFFDAFNHAQFAFAGSTLAAALTPAGVQYTAPAAFGRATARPPRVVQFALKFIW